RVAVRVPYKLNTAVGLALQEVLESVEPEDAAEASVKDLRHRSATVFVAKLDVVGTVLPGNVVDVVPVGVDTGARVAFVRTELSKIGDLDDWQAEILFADAGIQPDRLGVEGAVLGEEALGEAVPPQTGLIENRRGDGADIGQRHELNASRSDGVVVG